ncbi:hypothetical protein MRX96_006393 [Rhipicephalus microplus]
MAPAPAKSPLVLRRSAGPSGSEGGSPQLGSTLAAALLDSDSGSSSMQHHHPRPRPATVSSSAGDQGSFSFREHHAIPASQSHSSAPVPN